MGPTGTDERPRIDGLYLITSDGSAERSHLGVTAAALDGGVRTVQFRDKSLPEEAFAELAREVQRLCAEAGATFIVNDRARVAMRLRADGLHVGQSDLAQLDDWRPTWPALFGVSCNGAVHVPAALALGAGYIGCGPVYETSCEHSHKRVIGLGGLREALLVASVPVAAIGGIDEARIGSVVACGPSAVCVKSAIAEAGDMAAAARRLRERMEAGNAEPYRARVDGSVR